MNADGSARPARLRTVLRWACQFGPLLGLALVVLLFCVLCRMRDAPFASFYNLKTIVTQTVIVGIAALGMTMVIIAAGIDLSVGSLIALTTVVVALLLRLPDEGPRSLVAIAGGKTTTALVIFLVASISLAVGERVSGRKSRAGLSLTVPFAGTLAVLGLAALSSRSALTTAVPVYAVLAGLLAASACGWISGSITTRLRIVPFIATLGMMQVARGVAKWLGREQTVVAPENWLNTLMLIDPEPAWLVFAPGVWLMLVLLGAVHVLLRYTVFGRHTYAIGSNEATARLCGIDVELHRTLVFTVAAVFAGIAGVMQFANLTVGDPTAAAGMELDVIAAVVIGGGSLSGGEGTAVGTLVGALIMAVLRNGCNMLGVPNYVQNIIIGTVIVGAVATDGLKDRLRR